MPRPKRKALKRADGEGTLIPRKDKAGQVIGWKGAVTVGFKVGGIPDRRWVSGNTQEEVRRKLDVLKHQRDTGMLANANDITLEQFGRYWLENKPKSIRAITEQSYLSTLEKHLYPTLGHLRLDKLTAAHLDTLYKSMLDKGLSTRVVRYVHTLVHGMLKQALKWGKLARNVAEAATPPSLVTKKMQVWTPSNAVHFLEYAALDRLQAAWYLALFAGLRRAELLGLRWQDVDLAAASIEISQGVVEVKRKGEKSQLMFSQPKTRSSYRTLSISPDTVAVLQAHLERQNKERQDCGEHWQETGLVFTSSLGTPINPSNLARAYKQLIRRAGVPNIRLHDLRHTCASLAIARGDNPKVVSERLGHTSVAFTLNTYVKTFAAQRQEAALGIQDLFPRSPKDVPN
jgi:integrase